MGKIYYLIGKSASGKDTIYKALMSDPELKLSPVVMYTTRPKRQGEEEGKQYHFVSEEAMVEMEKEGKVLEKRCYDTVKGKWYYFTVDDGSIDLSRNDYLAIGTLESYQKIRAFGPDNIVPVYIEVDDGYRLLRALLREMEQDTPAYDELCRRYLADLKDFSEENLIRAGITKAYRFSNSAFNDPGCCIRDITQRQNRKPASPVQGYTASGKSRIPIMSTARFLTVSRT